MRRSRFPRSGKAFPTAASSAPQRKHRPHIHGLVLLIISIAVSYGILTNGGFSGRDRAFAAPVTGLSMPAAMNAAASTSQSAVLRPLPINKTIPKQVRVSPQQQTEAAQFQALGVAPTAVPTAAVLTEDAIGRAAIDAPSPLLPPYQVYTVGEGDTLSSIATRFGISPEYLVANNAEVQDANFLTLGQALIIPAGNGILHEVRYGDTLSDIASRYGVTVDAISSFASNGISDANTVLEQQLVYVPGGVLPVAAPVAEPAPDAEASNGDVPADDQPADTEEPAASGGGGIVGGGPSSSEGLIWPVNGPVSSYMGPSHPLGIDIDGFNLAGAGIASATGGTVVFAGGNACCSYGLYVIVVSPGGIETLYGHLSSISVSVGEDVAQGQQLGIIGSTGYSTGRHLHFEVIDNGVRVNPLNYLP